MTIYIRKTETKTKVETLFVYKTEIKTIVCIKSEIKTY